MMLYLFKFIQIRIKKIRERTKNIWEWLKKHPKQTYMYAVGLLLLSFVSFIAETIFSQPQNHSVIPTVLGKSDVYLNQQKEETSRKNTKIEKIIKELEEFQHKEELVKNDSIRIEYLLNQYQRLKNEK